MFTERVAIKQRMEEIREERRLLGDEYYQLMDRLRTLDDKEREVVDAESVVGNLSEVVMTIRQLIPSLPTDVMLTHAAQLIKESGVQLEILESSTIEAKPVAPIHEIKHQQVVDSNRHLEAPKKPEQKSKRTRLPKNIDEKILAILKETRREMKLEDIKAQVQELYVEELGESAFHARINNLVLNNPNVIKPYRGHYKYQL